MLKQVARLVFILLALTLLFACSKELNLEVKTRLDGKPAAEARVIVDEDEVGLTDGKGLYSGKLKKRPDAEVFVSVIKNAPGYRVEPWNGSFMMKEPPKGVVETYSIDAVFKFMKYITINVTEKGAAIDGATIRVKGKKVAITDATGQFVYEYKSQPRKGLRIEVEKPGYAPWRRTSRVEPGQKVEAAIHKEAVFTFKLFTETYGKRKNLRGVVIKSGKRVVGKTNSKGYFKYVYRGAPGKKAWLSIHAPGYIPAVWKKKVTLEGKHTIERFFHLAAPRQIKAGIYGYAGNVPGEDLSEMLSRIEAAVGNNLFSYAIFKEVSKKTLRRNMRRTKVNIGKATTKGWKTTPLYKRLDVVILGSIAKNEKGYLIETKAYTADGKMVLSQINTARGERDIKGVAKAIVRNIIKEFPFEGMVMAREKKRYKLNLGSFGYKLRRGMEFALLAPKTDEYGRAMSYREVGTLRLKKTRKSASWGAVVEIAKGYKARAGYRVIRRIYAEEEMRAAKDSMVLLAKGGVPPDVDPLRDVNIYLNERWIGTTGRNGKAVVPVKVGKTYDLMLYRHGYQQLDGEVKTGKDKELKTFVLNVNNSIFKVETQPSNAETFIDGVRIGRTPIRKGKKVNFGFHTLRLTVGGEYRDWEEVMDFSEKVVNRTGNKKIVMFKDYLRLGERAMAKGDTDGAIAIYSLAGKDHPDYSDTHYKLAQIYMDEKNDYATAINEFENVLSLPENEQLIYKQYAVTYTNLGHAYYEVGNGLIETDRRAAAQNFAKAIENLDTAKQNTRFLPTEHYDEAVHDTYYYMAVAYHKLYLMTRQAGLLERADFAWREYFDFFPPKLEKNSDFVQMRDSAEKYWSQIRDLM